jgi:adenylyltransferase/sulfurtransferase
VSERILVVGAGGLGCPALVALAEAGATNVTVIDPDRVEITNLHRQFLFRTDDVDRPKAEVAAEALERWYGEPRVEARVAAFRPEATAWLADFDIVLDATDRLATKLALHDACRQRGVDYVFASAVGWSGQVMAVGPDAPCLRCAFPQRVVAAEPTCAEVGVMGPVLGRVAARQVELALGRDAQAELHVYDGRDDAWWALEVAPRSDCPSCRGEPLRPRCEPEPRADEVAIAELDLRGFRCPDTYVRTRRQLEPLAPGTCLWVIFDSDESARQVPASAEAAGHRVLAQRRERGEHRLLVERGPA